MMFRTVPGIIKVIISEALFLYREVKEQLATVNGGVDEGGRLQLATVGDTGTRQRGMERPP